jgi:hypothetical protein
MTTAPTTTIAVMVFASIAVPPSCGDHGTNTGAATTANPSPAGIFHGKTALAEFRPNHRYSALTLASLRHKWTL